MIVLETDRLILRHVALSDLDSLASLFADPEVMRFSLGTQTREYTQRWIEGCLQDYQPDRWGFGLWAVVQKSTGQLIGFCGLTKFDDVDGQPEVEIGYRFAKAHWGQGFATEAAAATRDHAFSHLGMNRLISLIEAENIPSVRVAEKIGMSLEKTITMWDRPVCVYVAARPESV
jgi:RimJ/RimL family protein N-acetyltransferase